MRGNWKRCSKGFHVSGFPFIRALRALVFGWIISSKPHKCTIKSFWLYDLIEWNIFLSHNDKCKRAKLRIWQITLLESNMIKCLLKQWKERDYTFIKQQVFRFIAFPWKSKKLSAKLSKPQPDIFCNPIMSEIFHHTKKNFLKVIFELSCLYRFCVVMESV